MQKGFVGIIILVVVLILAGLGGAYYFSKSQVSKPQIQNSTIISQTPQSIISASPAPAGTGETANWKTYVSEDKTFSFKYPPNGEVQSFSTDPQVIINNNSNAPYFYLTVEITGNPKNLTSRQVLENEVLELREDKNMPGDTGKSLANYRQSTITDYRSGVTQGTSMRWGQDGDSVSDALEVVAVKDSKIYKFSIHDGNGAVEEYQKALLNQILSTFKFLP